MNTKTKRKLSEAQKRIWRRRKRAAKAKAEKPTPRANELLTPSDSNALYEAAVDEAVKRLRTGLSESVFGGPKNYEEASGVFNGQPFGPEAKWDKLSATNPKTLMGIQKVPVLSVVPPASILCQALAMRYGAYLAPKADGTRGYGPYNWRDQPIEASVYIDAAMRHLMQYQDGEDYEVILDDEGLEIDKVPHLGFAVATIGIMIDAYHNGTLIDTRPKVNKNAASRILAEHKLRNRR